ncbi:hypothetical protein FNV43_RR16785 [Rhamnella rubrinervis]|uniref:Uncharacterized protein n=1 Tax=Rhamnella rubrinervis TaxID=2594499 RepID=A0A8K0MDP8_9ROSA|nr:hypothetical protein FNV43_RR16785 [Rhamnella rubrinervis]
MAEYIGRLAEGYPKIRRGHTIGLLDEVIHVEVQLGCWARENRHCGRGCSPSYILVSRRIIPEGAVDIAHFTVISNLLVALKVIYNKL